MRRVKYLFLATIIGAFAAPPLEGYSVLSHEAIIDASWPEGIRALGTYRFTVGTLIPEMTRTAGRPSAIRFESFALE